MTDDGEPARVRRPWAELEQECDLLITRHQVRVTLEARAAGAELSAEEWLGRVADRVAADMMPRHGLDRASFLRLLRRVYRQRQRGGARPGGGGVED